MWVLRWQSAVVEEWVFIGEVPIYLLQVGSGHEGRKVV